MAMTPEEQENVFQSLMQDLAFWDSRDGGSLQKRRPPESPTQAKDLGSAVVGVHAWKPAVDPVSGNTYYYNTLTRQTQWEKVCQ